MARIEANSTNGLLQRRKKQLVGVEPHALLNLCSDLMPCLFYDLVEFTFTSAETHRLWLKSINPDDRVLFLFLLLGLGKNIPLMVPLSP